MSVADMTMREMQEELDATETEDELNDFVADLLAERRNEPFLYGLFLTKPGQWVSVSALCRDLMPMSHRLDLLQQRLNDSLFVTQLEYPDGVDSQGFRLIAFFAPMYMWSSTAVYNQAHLLHNSRHNGFHGSF